MKRAAAAAAAGNNSNGGPSSTSVPETDFAVGFTYELCAGILDKAKSLEEITCEEIEVWSGVWID